MSTAADRVAEAAARQHQWELDLQAVLEPPVIRFLRSVIGAATTALEAPTLLAAADPFAFTNIRKRWDTTVRLILHTTPASKLAHPALLDDHIAATLRAADLPDRAAGMAVDLLTRSRDEDWTAAKTKRELRKAILPPAPKVEGSRAESKEWAWYKSRVRAIARTAATRASSIYTIEAGGYSHKRWMTRRDADVRESHVQAHGQTVAADDAFMVGGHAMQYPGDLSAPPAEVQNCRCLLVMVDRDEDVMTHENMPDVLVAATTVSPWAGPIAFEGVATGDGRMMAPGSLTWDELPIPLRHVVEDQGEHAGAAAVGRIDSIERRADGVIWAEGVFDLGSERGQEAARLVGEGVTTGVSVDPDEWAYQIRVRKELLEQGVEEDPDGPGLALEDSEGRVTVAEAAYDDEMVVFTRVRIRAATLVDIPAYSRARIGLAGEPVGLQAAAGLSLPRAEWFDDPHLGQPTRLTVDGDRVFGHIATWDTCHTGFPGQCVAPPKSPSGYAYFHSSTVRALGRDGPERLAVGKITAGTGHASQDASPARTLAHYDNTGTTTALLRAGEDEFGIWVAGIVAPGATDEQVFTLESSPPSGDWRNLGNGLDLLAVLCVNTPGFPVPLVAAAADRYGPLSLVAAGVLRDEQAAMFDRELEYVRRMMRADEAAVLAGRVAGVRSRGRVAAMAATRRRGRN